MNTTDRIKNIKITIFILTILLISIVSISFLLINIGKITLAQAFDYGAFHTIILFIFLFIKLHYFNNYILYNGYYDYYDEIINNDDIDTDKDIYKENNNDDKDKYRFIRIVENS